MLANHQSETRFKSHENCPKIDQHSPLAFWHFANGSPWEFSGPNKCDVDFICVTYVSPFVCLCMRQDDLSPHCVFDNVFVLDSHSYYKISHPSSLLRFML